MHTWRPTTILAAVAVAGGLAFLAKLVAAAATDGAESVVVGSFYLLGVLLCAVGSPGIALRLLQGRHVVLRVVLTALAPLVFVASFLLLNSIAVPLTEDHVPNWARDEGGVFFTALIWLAAGLWAVSPRRRAHRGATPSLL
jgi:hypothetical protein